MRSRYRGWKEKELWQRMETLLEEIKEGNKSTLCQECCDYSGYFYVGEAIIELLEDIKYFFKSEGEL